jgi:hypothetical protein
MAGLVPAISMFGYRFLVEIAGTSLDQPGGDGFGVVSSLLKTAAQAAAG